MDTLDVVGLGAMNMDLLYTVERVILDGETIVDDFGSYPGGSAANTIYGLARLGLKASFVGAVGDDAYGQRLIDDLGAAGADTRKMAVKTDADTGQALGLSDKLGVRSLYILPGANALLSWPDIDLEYFNQCRLVHFSSFVGEAQLEIQRRLAARLTPSVRLSFSPGSLYAAMGLEPLAPILRRTAVLFLNVGELRQLTGAALRHGAKICLNHGCGAVVVTAGEGFSSDDISGLLTGAPAADSRLAAYVADGSQEVIVRARRVADREIRDTTGAGDAFAAGFLFGFLRGETLEECGLVGDAVAQFCIEKAGARAGLPRLSELQQKYRVWYGRGL